jgi:hypothetical protein
VSSLPDAERDALEVVEVLVDLATLLAHPLPGESDADRDDRALAEVRRILLRLSEDGGEAALRLLDYVRGLRGPGDGAAVQVAARLGPWREWVPPRGHLFGAPGVAHRISDLPHPRRSDPGE